MCRVPVSELGAHSTERGERIEAEKERKNDKRYPRIQINIRDNDIDGLASDIDTACVCACVFFQIVASGIYKAHYR